MNPVKRQLSFSRISDEQIKKLRTSTCLEELANELFYEIFEYLDGCDIYNAFSTLNIRFENLLTSSLLSLKISLSLDSQSTLEHHCRQVIIPHKHHILSLHLEIDSLINDFFDYCHIDSSFNCLESVVLNQISKDKILVVLFYLNSLPRLASLIIGLEEDDYYNLNNIYRLIFRFPYLKYNKLSIPDYEESDISIPISINEKPSTIERLVVSFPCTINEITSLLLHTPYLQHLNCEQITETDEITRNWDRLTLSYLTHISIGSHNIEFDEFEIFIKKISSQLRVLHLTTFGSPMYLDANWWKQLIKKHMPHLCELHLKYQVFDDVPPNHVTINQFTSSFWIEKQWFLTVEVADHEFIYSIYPYRSILKNISNQKHPFYFRKKWFNCQIDDQTILYLNPTISFIPPIQLTLDNFTLVRQSQSFIDKMKPCFIAVPFTHLDIDCDRVPIGMLMEIIRLLPHLDSLKVSSLPLVQLNGLSVEDSKMLLLVSVINKITKVKLNKMTEMKQIHLLMDLCPRMQYLEVECTTENDLSNIVGCISVTNITRILYLQCLCLCIPNANETMIDHLNTMIDFERRFHVGKTIRDFVIKRRKDQIFLNWKL